MSEIGTNRVILAGRLANDARIQKTENGRASAQYDLVVTIKFRDRPQPVIDKILCEDWGSFRFPLLKQGTWVTVEGRLRVFDGLMRVSIDECRIEKANGAQREPGEDDVEVELRTELERSQSYVLELQQQKDDALKENEVLRLELESYKAQAHVQRRRANESEAAGRRKPAKKAVKRR